MSAAAVEPMLVVRDLVKVFPGGGGWPAGRAPDVRAVDGVSFDVNEGETFGLVGESGCGKSTTARCLLRLMTPSSGEVRFLGRDVLSLSRSALRALRREMQIIFQDPFSSLDPRMTMRAILLEPLEIHREGDRAGREARVRELLSLVGLPESALAKYPHEFSGGQRQRIGIARALALSPRLLIADEPVSSLDLSIRAQVINLMLDLQASLGLTYLFIAHDLTLVRHVCHRVAVMYRGQIVEMGRTEDLFTRPLHPYTRRLLEAIPIPDPEARAEREEFRTLPPVPPASIGRGTELTEARPDHWVRAPLQA